MEPPSMIRKPFDDIPNCIIHTIFGLLEIKDIARLCTVSKGLRSLCFSMPYLSLLIEKFEDELQLSSFNYFLHTLLAERHGLELKVLNVKSFCPKFNSSERFDLKKLLYDAARLNVQELSLEIVTERFRLPPLLFNSIRVLKLNLHGGFLVLPNNEMGLVQELSLSCFKMIEGGVSLGDWISSGGKAIKKLELLRFDGIQHLEITNIFLEKLHILCQSNCLISVKLSAANLTNLSLIWSSSPSTLARKSFTVFAPILSRLTYVSNILQWSVLGNLNLLQFVEFRSAPPYLADKPQRDVLQNFCSSFSQLSATRNLILTSHVMNLLSEHDCAHGMSWKHLRRLGVYIMPSEMSFIIPLLKSFLKTSSKLVSLTIKYIPQHYLQGTAKKDYGESTVWCFKEDDMFCIDRLRNVYIDQIAGDDNEIKPIRYFLKHSKALKELHIFHRLDSSRVKKFIAKLECFSKASSDVSIKLVQRESPSCCN